MFGLSLSYPLALLVFPLGGAILTYIYMKGGRTRGTVVPSLVFFKHLGKFQSSKSKYKFPPRFFLELFVLFLISLLLAGIRTDTSLAPIAVLIDNSLSMSARISYAGQTTTRLALAKQKALKLVEEMGFLTPIYVYKTSPVFTQITPKAVTKGSARSIIKSIQYSHSKDNLESAIGSVIGLGTAEKIIVFSDKDINAQGENIIDAFSESAIKPIQNVAISDLSYFADAGARDGRLNIKVISYSERNLEGRLAIKLMDQANERIVSTDFSTVEASLTPYNERTFVVDVPYATAYEVKFISKLEDGIDGDNIAYTVRFHRGDMILVVSPVEAEELGIDALREFNFKVVSPEEYETLLSSELERYRGIIFHRYSPLKLPPIPSIHIYPEGSSKGVLSVRPQDGSFAIVDWRAESPMLKYLDPNGINLVDPVVLKDSNWMQGVVKTTAGTVMAYGYRQGAFRYFIGIELFPYVGAKDPFYSILLVNAVKLFANSVTNGHGVLPIRDKNAFFLKNGSWVPLVNGIGDAPGLYKIEDQIVALNAFFEEESNVFKKTSISVQEKGYRSTYSEANILRNIVGMLVLLILTGDFIIIMLKNLKRKRRFLNDLVGA